MVKGNSITKVLIHPIFCFNFIQAPCLKNKDEPEEANHYKDKIAYVHPIYP